MDVNLLQDMKPPGVSSRMDVSSNDVLMNEEITVKEENNKKKCTTTNAANAKIITEISSLHDNDSDLLASLPKAEVKLKKLDETKLLMDNNENSLSVDTLIEILSSSNSDSKLPILDNIKSEHCEQNGSENINVPPLSSAPSTLSSPSSSSSSKAGFSSPNTSETVPSCKSGPSPKSHISPKKFPSPYSNGGKPMMADLNKKMKQVSRRRSKPKTVYQSQISDNSVGIKLCIKKSINTFKTVPSPNSKSPSPRKRSRKSKTQTSKGKEKGCESDSDDSYVKRRKKPSTMNNNNSNKNSFEEPIEQSGWGKLLPKEVLSEVCRFVFFLFLFILFNLSFCEPFPFKNFLYYFFRFSKS